MMDCWLRNMCLFSGIISSWMFLTMVFKTRSLTLSSQLPLPFFTALITIWPSYRFTFSPVVACPSLPRPRMEDMCVCFVSQCILSVDRGRHLWPFVKGVHGLINAPPLILAWSSAKFPLPPLFHPLPFKEKLGDINFTVFSDISELVCGHWLCWHRDYHRISSVTQHWWQRRGLEGKIYTLKTIRITDTTCSEKPPYVLFVWKSKKEAYNE